MSTSPCPSSRLRQIYRFRNWERNISLSKEKRWPIEGSN